jgi:hypothetical protein
MFRFWSQNEINCSWTNDVAMFRNTLEWDQLFLNKWCCDVPEHIRMRSVVPEQMMLRCSGTHHRNEISCPWKNGVAMFRNTLEWDPLFRNKWFCDVPDLITKWDQLFLNKWCCDVPEHIRMRSVVPEQMILWCSGSDLKMRSIVPEQMMLRCSGTH